MDATSPGTIQQDEHAFLFPEAGASTTWPASRRYVQLIHRINRLRMAGTILHLGSHPDDEDSGMLAYMSHRHGMRTVYWSATRGEGGQNRRSPEKGEALGIVRTWESLEAREIDGGEVLYGPFYDFGFSKSGDDTLERWGRDEVVREIVRAIRLVQPLVVVCRWEGGPRDGHGHHQAIGLVAAEAFEAAGDSTRYGSLRQYGLAPWQAQKLYRSAAGDWQPGEHAAFGQIVDEYETAGYLRVDTGELDPVAGVTYQEQAHMAANRHRTQGFGFVPEPGSYHYYYRLDRSRVPHPPVERSFFDGLDPALTGLATYPGGGSSTLRSALADIRDRVDEAIKSFHPQSPVKAGLAIAAGAAMLRDVHRSLSAEGIDRDSQVALDTYLSTKMRAFDDAAAACCGLRYECLVERPRVTPGSRLRVSARAWQEPSNGTEITGVRLHVPRGWRVRPVVSDMAVRVPVTGRGPFEILYEVELPEDAPPSTPYWLREERTPYRYCWPQDGALGAALDPPLVSAVFETRIGSHRARLEAPGVHRSGFAGGSRELPLSVLPAMAISPRRARELLPVASADLRLSLEATVRCIAGAGCEGVLRLTAPQGWNVQPARSSVQLAGGGDSQVLRFEVTIPQHSAAGTYDLRYEIEAAGRVSGVVVEPVRMGAHGSSETVSEANCVAEASLTRPANVCVHLIDAHFVRTLRYAYVEGLDEDVFAALSGFGLDLTLLSDEDLAYADLLKFHAIVVGPNAYNVRAALGQHAARLLAYIAEGGTLIVQYQGYGYDNGLAPYPFRYRQPHDRVTAPDATVALLQPEHPVLSVPNRITHDDFAGWVGDRGLYFFGEWDRHYLPILASADRGEDPRSGGLVVASYGRGTYVYAAYSFFRQIPAGVPGAIRLFSNLLALAEARIRERMALLRVHDLFSFMADDEIYEVARMVSERWVEAGSFLAREGERGSELFVLVDGKLESVKELPGGERVLHVAQRGDAIGEFAVLANIPRSASIRALTDATVIVLPAETFQNWLRHYPDLALRVMQQLVKKIVASNPNQ